MSGLFQRIAWHANRFVCRHPALLNSAGVRLTVTSMFRSPGDTLLAGTFCRIIKAKYPRIRINCVVEWPELLKLDPAIETLNGRPGMWRVYFEYLGILESKDGSQNVLAPALSTLGILDYAYKCRVYLSEDERLKARILLGSLERPLVTFNVMSRESVKVWKLDYWRRVIAELSRSFTLVQLGDKTEPNFPEVISFAGKLSMRESMAVLSHSTAHLGPDSFLMHTANGLDVPSVIIFGGSRSDRNAGYPGNENLYRRTECSPCWIHTSKGESCQHGMKCMEQITPEQVLAAFHRVRSRENAGS